MKCLWNIRNTLCTVWNLLLPSRMKPNILIWKNTATFDPNRLGTGSKNKSPSCGLPTLRGAAASVSCPPSPCPWLPRSAHCLLRGQSHLKQTVCYLSSCRQDQAFIEGDSAGKWNCSNHPKCCIHLQTAQGQASLQRDSPSFSGSLDFHQANSWLRTSTFQELILVLLHHHQQTLRN